MNKMSKKLWIAGYAVSFGIFALIWSIMLGLGAVGLYGQKQDVLQIAMAFISLAVLAYLQFLIVSAVYTCLLLAKMWSPLQDGHTTVTVGKAIGFLFIPVFSIYWMFVAWGSYPKEYNAYIDRHRLQVPHLTGGVFTFYPVLLLTCILLVPLIAMPFVFMLWISKTCDAVNALGDGLQQKPIGAYAPQPLVPPGQYANMN